jgi:hypothetical protein
MTFCFLLDKLAQNPYDVLVWHLFFLLSQWCFALAFFVEATRHKERQIQLKHFKTSN